jgi:hypothetical protein
MDLINVINLLLYLTIGGLTIILAKRGEWVTAIALGTLALHGIVFNGVYIYRDLYWEACPPLCGLQEWSGIIRLHGLFAIITSMVYRLYVPKIHTVVI